MGSLGFLKHKIYHLKADKMLLLPFQSKGFLFLFFAWLFRLESQSCGVKVVPGEPSSYFLPLGVLLAMGFC